MPSPVQAAGWGQPHGGLAWASWGEGRPWASRLWPSRKTGEFWGLQHWDTSWTQERGGTLLGSLGLLDSGEWVRVVGGVSVSVPRKLA